MGGRRQRNTVNVRQTQNNRLKNRSTSGRVEPGPRRRDQPAAHLPRREAGSREASGAGGSARSWGPSGSCLGPRSPPPPTPGLPSACSQVATPRLGASLLPQLRSTCPARGRLCPPLLCRRGHEVRGSRQIRQRTKPGQPPPHGRAARSPPTSTPAGPRARLPPGPRRPPAFPLPPARPPPARQDGARAPSRAPYPPLRPGAGVLGAAVPGAPPAPAAGAPQARARVRPRRQLLAAVAARPPPPPDFFFLLAPRLPLEFFFFFTCPLQLPLVIGA